MNVDIDGDMERIDEGEELDCFSIHKLVFAKWRMGAARERLSTGSR